MRRHPVPVGCMRPFRSGLASDISRDLIQLLTNSLAYFRVGPGLCKSPYATYIHHLTINQ